MARETRNPHINEADMAQGMLGDAASNKSYNQIEELQRRLEKQSYEIQELKNELLIAYRLVFKDRY